MRLIFVIITFLTAGFSTIAFAQSADAKSKSTDLVLDVLVDRDLDEATRFVVNNTLYTMYHEVGHLLVDQLEWPVLSREEDVADNFATYVLLNKRRRALETTLKDSALGWKLEDQAYGGARQHVSAYYGEHSLDLQRAFQIVCLMVGKDRRTFYDTAQEWGIDRGRQSRCRDDYNQIADSFEAILTQETGATAKVNVRYDLAGEHLEQAYKTLRETKVLESVAQDIRTSYGLRASVEISAQRCGEPNAFYDSRNVEIIMCYELIDDYFDMINKHLASTRRN